MTPVFVAMLFIAVSVSAAEEQPAPAVRPPIAARAATRFLSKKVASWPKKNKCFSCHNNGDAARSLYAARRAGYDVPAGALLETTRWLRRPDQWSVGEEKQPFKDKRLARMQFTLAAVAALLPGRKRAGKPIDAALRMLIADQRPDGSWKVDAAGSVGSPATWGTTLATSLIHRMLADHHRKRHAPQIQRAASWLRRQKPKSVFNAASLLIGVARFEQPRDRQLRRHCLTLIRKGQSADGGWGPFVNSAPEPFDTAVVLLALAELPKSDTRSQAILRGRAWLIRNQLDDGSWLETTRPGGGESYAQRVSTTAWSLSALLATRARRNVLSKR